MSPAESELRVATNPLARGLRFLRRLVVVGIAMLLLLELICRVLPVNGNSGFPTVNAENPIARLLPNNTSTRSRGPRLSLVTEVRTNNEGFRNDVDYLADAEGPLVALVGDSYISATTVAFEETLAGRLNRATEDVGRVYSFGLRGAAFPQYLAWANHAREKFHPEGYVFLVIPNDFMGSFQGGPGYHYFVRGENDESELHCMYSRRNWRRELTGVSALARYLMLNCQIQSLNPLRWFPDRNPVAAAPARPRFVGNIEAVATERQMDDYRWAFQAFLERLPEATGVAMENIVFVMDGIRPDMYDPLQLEEALHSAWADLRQMVLEMSAQAGIEVVDLHPLFALNYAAEGERFDSKEDMHWNAKGHRIATEGTLASRPFRRSLGL